VNQLYSTAFIVLESKSQGEKCQLLYPDYKINHLKSSCPLQISSKNKFHTVIDLHYYFLV